MDNQEYLKDAAEYGPKNGKIAPGLLGWWTPKGWWVCAKCASRILGRGCQLPRDSEVVFAGAASRIVGVCAVCE